MEGLVSNFHKRGWWRLYWELSKEWYFISLGQNHWAHNCIWFSYSNIVSRPWNSQSTHSALRSIPGILVLSDYNFLLDWKFRLHWHSHPLALPSPTLFPIFSLVTSSHFTFLTQPHINAFTVLSHQSSPAVTHTRFIVALGRRATEFTGIFLGHNCFSNGHELNP